MRKLLFPVLITGVFSLVSFTYANQPERIANDTKVEIETYVSDYDETVNCRWRTCTGSGPDRQCGEWTYGTCEKGSDGTLTPNTLSIADNN